MLEEAAVAEFNVSFLELRKSTKNTQDTRLPRTESIFEPPDTYGDGNTINPLKHEVDISNI
jgi:hypothetical protein